MKKIVVLLIALLMVGGFLFADEELTEDERCMLCCPKRGCVDVYGCVPQVVCLRLESLLRSDSDEPVLVDDGEGGRCHCTPAYIPLLAPRMFEVTNPLVNVCHKSNCIGGYTIDYKCMFGAFTSGFASVPYNLKFRGVEKPATTSMAELFKTEPPDPDMTPVTGQWHAHELKANYLMGFYPNGCYWDRIYLKISAN